MKKLNLMGNREPSSAEHNTSLANTQRLQKLDEVQQQTFVEMLQCLEEFGICNVVRPTGFGKTKMFMDYVMLHPDARFIYVYDVNSVVEDITANYHPKNVEFISYTLLSNKASWDRTRQAIYSVPWHTIIFDESHLMGGENISQFCKGLIRDALRNGVRILGGTATQVRTDTSNVTDEFYGGHTVSEYTMRNAIQDGIMLEPYWVITVHMEQLLSHLRTRVSDNQFQLERIAQLDRAYACRLNVDAVYHETVQRCFGTIPENMQFIAFYPTIDSLIDGERQLRLDFEKAFPEHEVCVAKISSDPKHYSDIVTLQREHTVLHRKTILLIMAVNMLNQAYHSDSITGIIMNRATTSNIIFTQQLGRCLSVTANQRAIVFDNVGNAKISPDAFLVDMPQLLELSRNRYRRSGGMREHKDITVDASMDVLSFLEWYSRLCATCELTTEQVAMARRNWKRHCDRMSLEEFSKLSRMPSWFIEQEVLGNGCTQSFDT